MKRILLLALIISGFAATAQNQDGSEKCEARFKYGINNMFMSPLPVTAVYFYDGSQGNITNWFWDFGDGETSVEQNPMHIFSRPIQSSTVKINPYRVVGLTILTSDSCKSYYSDTINIMEGVQNPECNAGFKYYQAAYDTLTGSASIQFTNLSEGDSLSYFWQFNNGETSTEKEPLVIYDGTQYENKVCLTVTGTNGCTVTFCDAVYITNPNDTVFYPEECYTSFGYKINHEVQTFAPALVLDFYSKADPVAVEWFWDFGDGTTSTEENPMHIFNYPLILDSILGDPNPFRTVCLTVKTISGCKVSYCETINIYMNTEPECQARIKYYKPEDVITIPEVVPYILHDATEGEVVRRLWEFEDGTTSTEADPLVTFDIFKSTQKVCLTIYKSDGCSSTNCEIIYVSNFPPVDTLIYPEYPGLNYIMRYESGFPPEMSSCAGYAKAQVYLGDSLIKADYYKWSNGTEGQETKGLCPTLSYSVKAKTPDGTIVSGTFIFNSDGTVTETPFYWWITGEKENPVIQYRIYDAGYFLEWKLCDGTVVTGDSIQFNQVNCEGQDLNLTLKDADGNIVYSENVSSQSIATLLQSVEKTQKVKLFPNPVKEVLNIAYTGNRLDEITVEICDVAGKSVFLQKIYNIESGQNIGLNVNSLKSGIYLCKMVSGTNLIGIEKMVK